MIWVYRITVVVLLALCFLMLGAINNNLPSNYFVVEELKKMNSTLEDIRRRQAVFR